MALVCLIFGWKLKTMFGNKQHHAENMDVKKIVFYVRILYLLCCILSIHYTEVLKWNIQYFAIIRVFISSQEWAFEYCFGNKQ